MVNLLPAFGSLAWLISCLLIGIVITKADPVMVLPVAIVGAIAATAIELMPILTDDNLTIPIFSGSIMSLIEFALTRL
jgi:dolichol kinase